MAAAAADMVSAPSPLPPSQQSCYKDDYTVTVQILVILAVLGMFLLHVLGSLRRQSSHSLLHAIVVGVYTISYRLVGYTIGYMNSSGYYYMDFTVWAVFLLLLLDSTDSLTVCSLNDIDNWKGMYAKQLFKGVLLLSVLLKFALDICNQMDVQYLWWLWPLLAILLVAILKSYGRIASMRVVSKSYLGKEVKVIAEYMQYKDNQVESFDPVTMQGYSYIVAGDEKYCVKGTWYTEDRLLNAITTVEQIWQCTGNLMHIERKDLCLPMALSKMLNRRFAGFKLSESGLVKTRGFVFEGLLVGEERYQRAFRVIEEELVFVHDMYYTRYSYLNRKCGYMALSLPVIMFALCWVLTLTCLLGKHNDGTIPRSPSLKVWTILIILVLAFLELYQLYLYMASGWFKVALMRSYVNTTFLQSNCCLENMIDILLKLKAFRPWKRRFGQYCLLEKLGRQSKLKNCLHYATLLLVDRARKKGRKESIKLSENVKKAIVDSLLGSNNGHLTNGVRSLRSNGVDGELSWACDAAATEGAVTRTILLWHIATTLCEHQLDAGAKEDDTVRTASTLSHYCMHLLAFAPDLLPDHRSISESILDQTIDEAGKFLKGAKTIAVG